MRLFVPLICPEMFISTAAKRADEQPKKQLCELATELVL